jgi:transposase-like protein
MLGFWARRTLSDEHDPRIFPEAFKREAIDRITSGGLSVDKVATPLGAVFRVTER